MRGAGQEASSGKLSLRGRADGVADWRKSAGPLPFIMGRRTIQQFREERQVGQERVLATEHLQIKRFFRLDSAAYEDGALPGRTKELCGLVASMVLRCNDCIDYHLDQCVTLGFTREEIEDALNVALVVGGSIVIPHLRHAALSLDDLFAEKQGGRS